MQMRNALALSLQLGKLLSRQTSKPAPTDENQVHSEWDPWSMPVSVQDSHAESDSADVGTRAQEAHEGRCWCKDPEQWCASSAPAHDQIERTVSGAATAHCCRRWCPAAPGGEPNSCNTRA